MLTYIGFSLIGGICVLPLLFLEVIYLDNDPPIISLTLVALLYLYLVDQPIDGVMSLITLLFMSLFMSLYLIGETVVNFFI